MRLLVRGGSIPAGAGVTRSYVDMLSCTLEGIEIQNRSRFGDSSFEGVGTFYDDIDPFAPDMLLIHFGIDDAYRPVYRSEFKENLVQLVRLARNRFNPKIMLLTSHPFENQYEMEMIYGYYRAILEVARELACASLPIHSFWQSVLIQNGSRISDYLLKDPRYPNERGHALYARAVFQRIHDAIVS
jgi:lysophospholipase L1-like esterase